jgi:ATP-dependent Clp protease ATP-binding subunit ClpA
MSPDSDSHPRRRRPRACDLSEDDLNDFPNRVYDRFTDRACKLLVRANREAQKMNHDYIGTEHILLALCHEVGCVGSNLLLSLTFSLEEIRRQIELVTRSGPDMVTMGKLPMDSRAKWVIQCAVEEARQLGNQCIGTEHILLGLLDETGGIAANILTIAGKGNSLGSLRRTVLDILGRDKTDTQDETAASAMSLQEAGSLAISVMSEIDPYVWERLEVLSRASGCTVTEIVAEVIPTILRTTNQEK